MRKYFYLFAAVAAMSLAGCSGDEVLESASESKTNVEAKPITFENAFVDKSTRGTTPTDPSATVKTLGTFYVFGYQKDSLLFNAQPVTDSQQYTAENKATASPIWGYTPMKYWVADAVYNFVALANYTGDGTTASTALSSGVITTTITDFKNTGEKDLLVSLQEYKKGPKTISDQTDSIVSFTFQHLLSKVKFTFTNKFLTSDDVTLVVKDVKITNPYETGKVVITGAANGATSTANTVAWSSQASATTTTALEFGKTGEITPTNSDPVAKELLLIPGTKDYTITFSVDIYANADQSKTGAGTKMVTATYKHSVKISSLELKPGYTYNLTAELSKYNVNPDATINQIIFTVTSITGWSSPSDDEGVNSDDTSFTPTYTRQE